MNRENHLFSVPFGRLIRAFCAAVFCVFSLFMGHSAIAAPGDSGKMNSPAQVILMQPLQITKIKDMDFGRFTTGAAAGTVVINPDTSACTTTGSVIHFGGCAASEFGGYGNTNGQIRIRIRNILPLTGPGTAMALGTMTVDGPPDLVKIGNGNGVGNQRYRISTPSGIFNFRIGGTLSVNANQAPGTYTGSFDVTLDYQ